MTAAPTVTWPNLVERNDQLWRLKWSGWNQWIVPSIQLQEVIEANHELLDVDEDNFGNGWRRYLSLEIARITRKTPTCAYRRLYGVMSGEQRIVNADFAEAVCFAFGLNMDYDTKIVTMPGSMKLAEELIRCRSGIDNDLELRRQARKVVRISALILSYPHNTERLLDLAPHDCLRPYR